MNTIKKLFTTNVGMKNQFITRPMRSKKHSFNAIWVLALVLFGALGFQNCQQEQVEESPEYRLATDLAIEWNYFALELERNTMGFRPPVGARMFAHVEMAAYEASLPALQGYKSLETFLQGYIPPPAPFGQGQFYLPASLNAAYAQILRDFFPTAPDFLKRKIEQLEQTHHEKFLQQAQEQVVRASAAFGKNVAQTVWAWSKTDREGHDAHLYNYDHGYEPLSCDGCWQPTGDHPKPALLPYWGRVRPFYTPVAEVPIRPPVAYQPDPGSEFYTEAMEVFSVTSPLSKENLWIAEFWSDDLPGLTLTPAGRWISIANQAFEQARPPFPLVIETYLKTALALNDAGIIVWHGKYEFNVERPETYIRERINPDWRVLHETPSFPAYPSGHAAFGASAAMVLSEALGAKFELTDRTHEKRPEFASTPRTYGSFMEMARENAASRVFLGVHFRMDCKEGLRLGKIIGKKTADLELVRKEAAMLKR
jgi:membrane-associated phospholipid phosphatase